MKYESGTFEAQNAKNIVLCFQSLAMLKVRKCGIFMCGKWVETVAGYELRVVGEEGYTTKDAIFRYTVLPACQPPADCLTPEGQPSGYNAIIADIDLYRIDDAGNESWVGYPRGDSTQGEGETVLVAGASFDITKTYKAEVVLNRGSDVEIRGKRIELVVSEIKVMNDRDTTEVDEIKFGDGSNTEKVYHVELVSKALTKACEDLRGAIRVVDRNEAALEPDTNVYYFTVIP